MENEIHKILNGFCMKMDHQIPTKKGLVLI